MGKAVAPEKTNAMRMLEAAGVAYTGHTYEVGDHAPGGMEVADAIVSTKRDMRDKPVVDQRMKSIRVETFGQVYPFDQM